VLRPVSRSGRPLMASVIWRTWVRSREPQASKEASNRSHSTIEKPAAKAVGRTSSFSDLFAPVKLQSKRAVESTKVSKLSMRTTKILIVPALRAAPPDWEYSSTTRSK